MPEKFLLVYRENQKLGFGTELDIQWELTWIRAVKARPWGIGNKVNKWRGRSSITLEFAMAIKSALLSQVGSLQTSVETKPRTYVHGDATRFYISSERDM